MVLGLQGKVAIVTGGGQGIGRALTLRLAAEGCKVAIFDLKAEAGEETAGIAGEGAVIKTYALDVSDQDAVTAAVEAVETDLGPVWALVNNAGWDKPAPFLATDKSLWDKIIAILGVSAAYLESSFAAMVAQAGSVPDYLKAIGVGDDIMAKVRARFLA